MRRRQFIRFVGGAMAAWPLAARSQEPRGQTRLIGVVVPFSKTDSEVRPLLAAFNQRFRELGWTEGHNVRIEYRFTAGNSEQLRAAAAELGWARAGRHSRPWGFDIDPHHTDRVPGRFRSGRCWRR